MVGKVDLHTHSTASDGLYTPGELARRALDLGVTVLAICDHDTVAGARELKGEEPGGLTFVEGVELSARTRSGKCHILGLGCRTDAPEFKRLMEKTAGLRRGKLEARLEFLRDSGLQIPEPELKALRAMSSAGKPQVADVLVRCGFASDVGSAIRDILNKCPPVRDRVEAGEAISAVRASGGVAVWAHPMGETGKRALTALELDVMLGELLEAGIMGMECWYSKYGVEQCLALERTAAEHGLYVSGGSDGHGRPDTAPPGRLNSEDMPVAAERLTVLEALAP